VQEVLAHMARRKELADVTSSLTSRLGRLEQAGDLDALKHLDKEAARRLGEPVDEFASTARQGTRARIPGHGLAANGQPLLSPPRRRRAQGSRRIDRDSDDDQPELPREFANNSSRAKPAGHKDHVVNGRRVQAVVDHLNLPAANHAACVAGGGAGPDPPGVPRGPDDPRSRPPGGGAPPGGQASASGGNGGSGSGSVSAQNPPFCT